MCTSIPCFTLASLRCRVIPGKEAGQVQANRIERCVIVLPKETRCIKGLSKVDGAGRISEIFSIPETDYKYELQK